MYARVFVWCVCVCVYIYIYIHTHTICVISRLQSLIRGKICAEAIMYRGDIRIHEWICMYDTKHTNSTQKYSCIHT